MSEDTKAGKDIGEEVNAADIRTIDGDQDACVCFEPGPETIEVEQVLGAQMAQRVLEFDMFVPERKPPIEQVIDVYIKDLEIKEVTVIRDKVIVRGDLAVKVMYVADLPNQPVHAFEKRHVRWTRDIEIEGARPEMDATADVAVEFVDYDFHRRHDDRKVHITIVFKAWARVVSTTQMEVYALTPVDYVSDTGSPSATLSTTDKVSASSTGGGDVTAVASETMYGPDTVSETVTPIVTPLVPTAGTPVTTNGTATVTGRVVNVRSGPGTNFPIVSKVNQGTVVTLREQAFGWYRVMLPDGSTNGWIAGWLLDQGMVPVEPKG